MYEFILIGMYTSASQKDVYNWCKQRFSIVLYDCGRLSKPVTDRKIGMYTSASQKDVYNWCKQRFSIVLYDCGRLSKPVTDLI